jgi:16S rRNA (cytosine967-C5)-methyltransferase
LRDWRLWLIGVSFGDTFRSLSIRIIQKVEDGRFLDEVIDRHFSAPNLSDKEKGFIHEIVSGVIRWRGFLEWVVSRYAERGIKREVRCLLWITLYQVSFLEKAHYHVVNEAVEYAKRENGAHAAKFVNAVLRRYLREKEGLLIDDARSAKGALSIKHSFPEWIVERWLARFGRDEAEKLMSSLNVVPEFTLRVDVNRISRDEVSRLLAEKGVSTRTGQFLPACRMGGTPGRGPLCAGCLRRFRDKDPATL